MTTSVSATKKASGSNVPMTTASAATTSKNCCLSFYQNFNDNIRTPYQKASATICPDIEWNSSLTGPNFILSILQKPGPSDGTCSDDKDIWRIDGSNFNLPSKCVCVMKPNVEGSIW